MKLFHFLLFLIWYRNIMPVLLTKKFFVRIFLRISRAYLRILQISLAKFFYSSFVNMTAITLFNHNKNLLEARLAKCKNKLREKKRKKENNWKSHLFIMWSANYRNYFKILQEDVCGMLGFLKEDIIQALSTYTSLQTFSSQFIPY